MTDCRKVVHHHLRAKSVHVKSGCVQTPVLTSEHISGMHASSIQPTRTPLFLLVWRRDDKSKKCKEGKRCHRRVFRNRLGLMEEVLTVVVPNSSPPSNIQTCMVSSSNAPSASTL